MVAVAVPVRADRALDHRAAHAVRHPPHEVGSDREPPVVTGLRDQAAHSPRAIVVRTLRKDVATRRRAMVAPTATPEVPILAIPDPPANVVRVRRVARVRAVLIVAVHRVERIAPTARGVPRHLAGSVRRESVVRTEIARVDLIDARPLVATTAPMVNVADRALEGSGPMATGRMARDRTASVPPQYVPDLVRVTDDRPRRATNVTTVSAAPPGAPTIAGPRVVAHPRRATVAVRTTHVRRSPRIVEGLAKGLVASVVVPRAVRVATDVSFDRPTHVRAGRSVLNVR